MLTHLKETKMDKFTKLQNQVKDAFQHLDSKEIEQEAAYILETADMVMDLHQNRVKGDENYYIDMYRLMQERGIDRDMKGSILYQRGHADILPADANITKMITEPLKAKHEKRNYRIAKALLEKGVEEFDFSDQEIVYGNGFETEWKVEDMLVILKVIFAGGHNIQRRHPRILVAVKKLNKEVA